MRSDLASETRARRGFVYFLWRRFEPESSAFAYSRMEFIIIAKSTDGWGVVVGGDMVAEFAAVTSALEYAASLRAINVAGGRPTEVVDLSEANTGYPLLKRPDGPT